MGASGYEREFKTTSARVLTKTFKQWIEEEGSEYGSNPYSGSLATLTGITIVSDPYPNSKWTNKKKRDVISFLYDRAQKWDDALAVKTSKSFLIVAWLAS